MTKEAAETLRRKFFLNAAVAEIESNQKIEKELEDKEKPLLAMANVVLAKAIQEAGDNMVKKADIFPDEQTAERHAVGYIDGYSKGVMDTLKVLKRRPALADFSVSRNSVASSSKSEAAVRCGDPNCPACGEALRSMSPDFFTKGA